MVSDAAEKEVKGHLSLAPTPKARRYQLLVWIGLALLSGLLWAIACANFSAWPLAWIAMIPGLYAIERAPSLRSAIFVAWLIGLMGNAGGFYWMIGTMERFAGLSWPLATLAFLLVCGFHAIRLILFGWALRLIRQNSNLPMALVAPLLMVAVEMCVPLIFQYYLAMALARQPLFIQIADLTGVAGVTALLLMVNGALYDLIINGRTRIKSFAVTMAILFAVLGYGALRIKQIDAQRAQAPKIKIGIVQPNTVNLDEAGGGGNRVLAQRKIGALQARSAELEAMGADLILWPESSYPTWISRQTTADRAESHPARVKRGFTVPLVFNAITYNAPLNSGPPYNSALVIDRDGKLAGRYDKNYLFMFGEYMPGSDIFPWLKDLSPMSEQYAAGEEAVTLPFQDKEGREWRLGPMICLEDILSSFGRQLAAKRPHLLVNLTNDSWFGDTREPWQHLALSVFRSVELRTDLVRAVNTGVSAYVDATGRIYAETYVVDPAKNPRDADTILAEVALAEAGHTVYAVAGDFFGYTCIALALALCLILPRRRRRNTLISSLRTQ